MGVYIGGNSGDADTCLNDFWINGYYTSYTGLRLAFCDHNRYREVSLGYAGRGIATAYAVSCKAFTTPGNTAPVVAYEIFDQLQVNEEILLSGTDDGGNLNPPLGLQFRNTEPNTVFTVVGSVSYRAWNRNGIFLFPPTIVVKGSGSGTYNPPLGCTRIEVEGWGGGGGGASSGAGSGHGFSGGDTTFGGLVGGGGVYGSDYGGASNGGTASGGDININGGSGPGALNATNVASPSGASGPYGGAGGGSFGYPGNPGAANSGAGGSGGGGSATVTPVGSGAAGGYFKKMIVSPSGSYAYSVGAGGNGSTTGAFAAGGAGGSGMIIIREFYD